MHKHYDMHMAKVMIKILQDSAVT